MPLTRNRLFGEYRDHRLGPVLERGWFHIRSRDAITKTFVFRNFDQARHFMNNVTRIASELNHYPELFACYKTIQITLWTPECDGISDYDLFFADVVDSCSRRFPRT